MNILFALPTDFRCLPPKGRRSDALVLLLRLWLRRRLTTAVIEVSYRPTGPCLSTAGVTSTFKL
jgi:hypothetical protein